MSVSEFSEMVRKDAQFLYDNPEALFKDFEDLVYNVIPLKLPEVFLNIPKAKLKMERLSSPHSTTAFYSVGAYDGSRPGVYFVNTFHCDSQPKYEMMTLSLHEGNPGHHLQGSHSMESPKIPFFRRVMEDRNYWQAPSRCGHYSFEMYRACRLVVDTGLHAFSWTRQEAGDYMIHNTALASVNVE
ncbi:hypothetical protein Hamer_G026824, partial [Homarus americanus]